MPASMALPKLDQSDLDVVPCGQRDGGVAGGCGGGGGVGVG